MKILRDVEWSLLGYDDNSKAFNGTPAIYFKHKQYGDVTALKAAKYILTATNEVYFYTVTARGEVSVSKAHKEEDSDIPTFLKARLL